MLFNTGSFSSVAWYDREGNYRTINMDEGALSLMAFFQMIAGGVLVFKQGKITKAIFGPIVHEYRQAEAGETNGIQMTYRKAPKMQWLKKQVKRITCWMIVLNIFTLMTVKNFALDIATQAISQEYELMEKKNKTTIDFNMDPNQFWMNKNAENRPAFKPFEMDDDLDFDFDFDTEMKEEDIFKLLGNSTEINNNLNPFFNTTEIIPALNETSNMTAPMPLPLGRGDHDKKHHWKHHQKHPKNMMKHGFQYDMHRMSKEELLQKVGMVIPAVMTFIGFFMICGVLFW